MFRTLMLSVGVLAACSSAGPEATRRTESPAPAAAGHHELGDTPPALRLPRTFLPSASRIAIALDPDQERFTGRVEIDGALSAPTSLIWLHARGLDIRSARAVVGDREVPLSARIHGEEYLALRAPDALPTGPLTLVVHYEGVQDEKETAGVFRQRSGDAWYSFTQFEATYGRRAFPSFDEPDVKIPWQVTIDAPKGSIAVSNTSATAEEKLPTGTRYRFAKTRPMPSYLVAFAVGPFETVSAGKTPRGVPLRIVVPRGRSKDAAVAAQITPRVVAALESWFGTPYPYDKLDSIAIPVTVGFGAMENAGLITYKESLLLIDPSDTSLERRHRYAAIATHEISHQWFGNLVTTAWWDDIWLNEGFATWMTDKIMETLYPQWGTALGPFSTRRTAMANDALVAARKVRQQIVVDDDIDTAFDAITYRKGASVLRMFERWVGPAVFQKGVRAYLAAHAWGNATSTDFAAAITAAAGKDVGPAFASFLDQPGLPRLAVELECPKDEAPRVSLHQSRYLPHGTEADEPAPWKLPVCIAYGRGGTRGTACALVEAASAEIAIPGKVCPTWFHPNAGGAGYYRAGMTAVQLDALVRTGWKQLTAQERLSVFDDVIAMAERGDVPVTAALGMVAQMIQEKSRYVVEAATDFVTQLESSVPAGSEAGYRAWIVKTLGPRARQLGWLPRPGDTLDAEQSRVQLVSLVADAGEPVLREQAIKLAASWRTLPSAMRKPVLSAAIDDPAVFAAVMEAAMTEPDRKVRTDLFDALGYSRDREHLRAALGLLLDKRVDPRDAEFLYKPTKYRPAMRAVTEEYLRENMRALLARLPRRQVTRHAEGITNLCQAARRDEVARFAQATFADLPGGSRRVAQAVEAMDQCIARGAMYEASLRAWLAPQRTGASAVRPPMKAPARWRP